MNEQQRNLPCSDESHTATERASELNIGVHLSLGPHPELSIRQARSRGAGCVQIFCSSPGAWKPPILRDLKVAELAAARSEHGVDPMVIHAIYLINLASADPVLLKRSTSSLVATLEAAETLGASAVTTHLGSHGGRGYDSVAPQVAAALVEVLESASGTALLSLENSAGAGGLLGAELRELADLIDRSGGHPRLRVTLDTAHLCAAGWDFQQPGVATTLVESLSDQIGLDRLVAIHANDSKTAVGSRRDRHARIGEGHIGQPGFERLLFEPELRRVPWILETPDLDPALPEAERFVSVQRLRSLAVGDSMRGPLP